MHAYTNTTLFVDVCVCVLDVRVHGCVCALCGNYSTQNRMELIGGLLYFNYLPSCNNWFVQYTPCFTDGYSMVDDSCGDLSVIDYRRTM